MEIKDTYKERRNFLVRLLLFIISIFLFKKGDEVLGVNTVYAETIDIEKLEDYTVIYTYNIDGTIRNEIKKDLKNKVLKNVTYSYNKSGDIVSKLTFVHGNIMQTTYNYDNNGRISIVTNKCLKQIK